MLEKYLCKYKCNHYEYEKKCLYSYLVLQILNPSSKPLCSQGFSSVFSIQSIKLMLTLIAIMPCSLYFFSYIRNDSTGGQALKTFKDKYSCYTWMMINSSYIMSILIDKL